MTPPSTVPVTGAWREGDPPGRRQFATVFASRATCSRRAAGSQRHRRVRDLGHARTRHATTRCSCCTRSPATATRPARRARAPRDRLVGRHRRAGQGDRHRPVLRGVPERARRLPGHDRARRRSTRDRHALRVALPDHHDPRPGRRRGRARRHARHRPLGGVIGGSMGGQRALEWAVSFPERVPRASARVRGRATAEEIALVLAADPRDQGRPGFRGGDYYDAEPGVGPWRGMSLARGIGQVSYRSEQEFDERFGRGRQGDEEPLDGRPVRGRVLPRVPRREARATASTRTPTSCSRAR